MLEKEYQYKEFIEMIEKLRGEKQEIARTIEELKENFTKKEEEEMENVRFLTELYEKGLGLLYCKKCNCLWDKESLKPDIKKETVPGKLICGSDFDGIREKIEKIFVYYKCPTCGNNVKILS